MILLVTALTGSCVFYYLYNKNNKLIYEQRKKKWIEKNTQNRPTYNDTPNTSVDIKSRTEVKPLNATEYQCLLKTYIHEKKIEVKPKVKQEVKQDTIPKVKPKVKQEIDDNPIIMMASL